MSGTPPIRPKVTGDHHFELPCSCDVFRRAVPQIVEAILVPLGLFYAALSVLGPKGAICTALAWNFMALLRRLWRRERLPGVLLLGTVGLTARSVVALVSSSSLFVYFLQPSLGTALLGVRSCSLLPRLPIGREAGARLRAVAAFVLQAAEGPPAVRTDQPAVGTGKPYQCSRHARIAAQRAHRYVPGSQDGPFVGAHRGRRGALVVVVSPRLASQQRRDGRRSRGVKPRRGDLRRRDRDGNRLTEGTGSALDRKSLATYC